MFDQGFGALSRTYLDFDLVLNGAVTRRVDFELTRTCFYDARPGAGCVKVAFMFFPAYCDL